MSRWELGLTHLGGRARWVAMAAFGLLCWRLAVVAWQDELGLGTRSRETADRGGSASRSDRSSAVRHEPGAVPQDEALPTLPRSIASAIGLRPRPSPQELLELVGDAPPERVDAGGGDAGPRDLVVTLAIDVGPSRSEVFVSGVQKGHTPYFGDHTCVEGTTVRVDVLPPHGMPIRMKGVCQPGTLRTARPE